jgi:hypothetical protein
MRFGLFGFVVAFLLSVFSVFPAGAAQQETPAGGCDVPRRSVAAIVESAGTSAESQPIPDAIPYVAPAGSEPDVATAQAVAELLADIVDCVNKGDIVGFLSLFSDGFLRRHFGEFGMSIVELREFQLEPVEPGNELVLHDARDVTVLPDGRISVLVQLEQGDDESPQLTSVLTLDRRGDDLVVDEWQPVAIESNETGWSLVEGPGYHGRIVPLDEVPEYVRWVNGAEAQGAWTPTDEQIAELESELPGFLRTLSSISPDLDDRLPEYSRHYLGYVEDGHAFIMVNAFCSIPGGGTESEPVIVMDGGDCYFYTVWDPTAGEFVSFQANGEA